MSTPQLSFIYAYPLDRERRTLFEEKSLPYPSMREVKDTLIRWEQLWLEADQKHNIVAYISALTGRIPTRNLECFVFGGGLRAMSTPFLLPTSNKRGERWSDTKFLDLVMHELLHIFLVTDNARYWEYAKEKYKDEEPLVRNHVLLYAMLYEIYRKLFNTEPFDFSRTDLPEGYARAIELMKQEGHETLIAEYKALI